MAHFEASVTMQTASAFLKFGMALLVDPGIVFARLGHPVTQTG